MLKIPTGEKLPEWINENVPPELAGSTLFRFLITLQTTEVINGESVRKSITVDMLPDLDLDMEILESQMEAIPAQFAFWASVYSELKLAVGVAERNLKIRRGKAVEEINRRYHNEKLKPPSAEQVKTIVESDDQLVAADMRLLQAQMQTGKLYHMLEALRMKAELARSLAGFKRQELNNS